MSAVNPWKSSISGKSTDGGMELQCTSFTLNTVSPGFLSVHPLSVLFVLQSVFACRVSYVSSCPLVRFVVQSLPQADHVLSVSHTRLFSPSSALPYSLCLQADHVLSVSHTRLCNPWLQQPAVILLRHLSVDRTCSNVQNRKEIERVKNKIK